MTDRLFETGNTMKADPQPDFEHDTFTEMIEDVDGIDHPATITFEGFVYDGALRLTKLEVKIHSYDEYTEESVLELIRLRNNTRVSLECCMELV